MAKNTINLEVVTPARAVLDIQVDEVVLPGAEGELGVLPGHLPLLTTLDIGQMAVRTPEGTREFFVDGGFAEILRHKVTVLTEACDGIDEIDIEHAEKMRAEARRELEDLLERSKTEPVEEDVLDHHRKMLKRAQTRLLMGEGGKSRD